MGETRPAPILSASSALTERSSKVNVVNAQILAPAAPSAPKPWFESWFDTPYYHQLYGRHDEQEAAGFVDALIGHLHPAHDARMVDVGCGAGRHSRALAAHGYDVTGYDLSVSSIRQARMQAGPRLHFYRHDMRQPFCRRYDFVFNFFTSFGYFDGAEHERVLRNLTDAVDQGGTLVIDYLNVAAARSKPHEIQQIRGVRYQITRWSDASHFYKRIVVEDGAAAPREYRERVAKFELADFQRMLAGRGMRVEEVFGDYRLAPWDPATSPRLIMV